MGWYEYRQNNSGGGFDYDSIAGISTRVWVEADNADEADERAEEIGLYFGGEDEDGEYIDCECCGDRWNRAYGKPDKQDQPYYVIGYGRPWIGADKEGYAHPKGRPFYALKYARIVQD